MSPAAEKAFKNTDYVFKFVSWEILTEGVGYAATRLGSWPLRLVSMTLSALTAYTLSSMITAYFFKASRIKVSERPIRDNIILLVAALAVASLAVFANIKLENEISRLVTLGR